MNQKQTRAEKAAAPTATESDELRLHGGLHGRMAGAFGTLQSSVDALDRYLSVAAVPSVYETARTMLNQMCDRIAYLERLSDNAASLAMGAATRGAEELAPLDLTGYLAEIASCANESLALRGFAARVCVTDKSSQGQTWILGSTGLLDGIFTNLLSNMIQARRDGTMNLVLEAGRVLTYSDDGPGMDPATAKALLEEGRPTMQTLSRGAIGLLLVRDYAVAMGWQVCVQEGEGVRIRFRLPPFDNVVQAKQLRDAALGRDGRSAIMAAHLDRELDGVFGTSRGQ